MSQFQDPFRPLFENLDLPGGRTGRPNFRSLLTFWREHLHAGDLQFTLRRLELLKGRELFSGQNLPGTDENLLVELFLFLHELIDFVFTEHRGEIAIECIFIVVIGGPFETVSLVAHHLNQLLLLVGV